MLDWRFRCFVSASGRNESQDTIDRYDDASLMAFSRAVAYLAVSPISDWNEPHAKKLTAQRRALFEVRYKANKAATRALGFFGPQPGQFTITLICTHKQNVYKPPDALDTAARRASLVESGQASTAALQIYGENFPAAD